MRMRFAICSENNPATERLGKPENGRETPACKYCDFASVCGREDEPCFRVLDLKNEEIFEKLKKGDEYGV